MKKMNSIRRHIPAFVETSVPPPVAEFSSLNELLEVDFVKEWVGDDGFYRFSQSENRLMAELKKGKEWWVVGYLAEPVTDLPPWVPVGDK